MTRLSSAWHILREAIDIVRTGVADEIRVRIMLAQIRWHMRTHENQPALDEVFRNAERELLDRAWLRKALGEEPRE